VDTSTEQLTQRLQQLSDAELLQHVQESTLVPQALEIARGILRSRGLEPAPDGASGSGLVTLVELPDAQEAQQLRARLESQGIPVRERPAATGRKLQVRGEHLDRAMAVVAAFTPRQAAAALAMPGCCALQETDSGAGPGAKRVRPKREVDERRARGDWGQRLLVVLACLVITAVIGLLAVR
jgi:hypothetical protein